MSTRWMSVLIVALGAASACAKVRTAPEPETFAAPDDPALGEAPQAKLPPPISGGTLHVTPAGLAVAADPDRDRVWLVDLTTDAVGEITLEEGDEPGRVAEDGHGHAFVALRGGGAVVSIDLAARRVVRRTPVCPAPRGLAHDPATDGLHVACEGGELVTLSAGGAVLRRLVLERDLRDVIVRGTELLVTRLRSAEILRVAADGSVLGRTRPATVLVPTPGAGGESTFSPTVAWRAVGLPDGRVAVAHQRSADAKVLQTSDGGWGGGRGGPCGDGALVDATVTLLDPQGGLDHAGVAPPSIVTASLPVDVATDGQGDFAVAAAGSRALYLVTEANLAAGTGGCQAQYLWVGGQPTAVAFWDGRWIAQSREPAGVTTIDAQTGATKAITLDAPSVRHEGHDLFHQATAAPSLLACASCHPEGREDGHVWSFGEVGPRRTQTVAGGVLETLPLHWDGSLSSLDALMDEVFVRRMGGGPVAIPAVKALGDWLESVPPPKPGSEISAALAVRGQALFHGTELGCSGCHGGPHLTDGSTVDVGTGAAFQVPSLVGVAARAPFMHDGCARTLRERFDPNRVACHGGDAHGRVSGLSPEDVDALVAYLEAL